ncbi:putative UBA-like superfamily protein [Arabidopsis thaliana]|uniref:Uncharacterized protein n=2 Tax=Arabidopsis TaxID=3701 RepID=A0A178VUW1_ARATH|nr:UBA-like superfamily [Arabidopsis thaliana x Arabidopsis arenosa]OAP09005.1 hypothetical protein AXX17_AT2G29430 [Arabidopsis thaliana]
MEESRSPAQIGDEHLSPTAKADLIDRICAELGVCEEEALCYLDGFHWDFDSALEACRNQTSPFPPSLTVESTPVNANSASLTTPLMIDPLRSWNPPDEQSRNESIARFCYAVAGVSVEEARAYLERSNWNINLAVDSFLVERRATPLQKKSNPLRLDSKSRFLDYSKPLRIGRSSSDSMEVDSTGEQIPEAIPPLMASSQVNTQENQESTSVWPPMKTWVDRICHETKVSREEAFYYLEGSKWNFSRAVEACRSKTLPVVSASQKSAEAPPNSPEQPSLLKNEWISSFCEAASTATREEAIYCLKVCNWDVHRAIGFYMEDFSEHQTSVAVNMSLKENRKLPLSSIELPSQSQFEASLGYLKEGSTSSLLEVDPTELKRSLEEAGEENAAVAIPRMTSSQVDGKGIEEDSSMETFPDPVAYQDRIIVGPRAGGTTITLTILLANTRSVNIPFRSNQTVRDIRDAIDELTPDYEKDYILQSMAEVVYMDPDITVHEISTGSTTLLQIYL